MNEASGPMGGRTVSGGTCKPPRCDWMTWLMIAWIGANTPESISLNGCQFEGLVRHRSWPSVYRMPW